MDDMSLRLEGDEKIRIGSFQQTPTGTRIVEFKVERSEIDDTLQLTVITDELRVCLVRMQHGVCRVMKDPQGD